MQLAILGSSGRIGGHLLAQALEAGHQVQALARNPQSLPSAPGLTVVVGDAADGGAVAATIAGVEAVLSALGPRGAKTPALLATAAGNIIAAMDKAGSSRLICVSAAGAFIQGDPDTGPLIKFVLPRVLARQFADVREMEGIVAATDLDWTMVRATQLVNKPPIWKYRVRPDFPPPGGRRIARGDVAGFMMAALADKSWIREAPALAY